MTIKLPKDFFFGAAMSGPQTEGAWNVGGRLRSYWDMYSDMEINSILEDYKNGAVKTLPARDVTGHGNEVAVIACGRSGVASDADILIVKLGNSGGNAYIRDNADYERR